MPVTMPRTLTGPAVAGRVVFKSLDRRDRDDAVGARDAGGRGGACRPCRTWTAVGVCGPSKSVRVVVGVLGPVDLADETAGTRTGGCGHARALAVRLRHARRAEPVHDGRAVADLDAAGVSDAGAVEDVGKVARVGARGVARRRRSGRREGSCWRERWRVKFAVPALFEPHSVQPLMSIAAADTFLIAITSSLPPPTPPKAACVMTTGGRRVSGRRHDGQSPRVRPRGPQENAISRFWSPFREGIRGESTANVSLLRTQG